MTVKTRERKQNRIAHRIMMTVKVDGIGDCDECHESKSLYDDKAQAGEWRMCAQCWAKPKHTEARKANAMPS